MDLMSRTGCCDKLLVVADRRVVDERVGNHIVEVVVCRCQTCGLG
jgi:hypothetical protein